MPSLGLADARRTLPRGEGAVGEPRAGDRGEVTLVTSW